MTDIHVDGAGFNSEVSKLCVIVIGTNKRVVSTVSEKWTNNEAEYRAVLQGIVIAEFGDSIWTDSQLVVSQVNGSWRTNEEHLRKLRDEVRSGLLRKKLILQKI